MAISPCRLPRAGTRWEPKTVLASSFPCAHFPKMWSCSRWMGRGAVHVDGDEDIRTRGVGVGVAVVVGEGLRVGGACHAHLIAVRFEEGFEPVCDVQGLLLLGEAVLVVYRPRVRSPVASVDDHLSPAVGLPRPRAGQECRGEENDRSELLPSPSHTDLKRSAYVISHPSRTPPAVRTDGIIPCCKGLRILQMGWLAWPSAFSRRRGGPRSRGSSGR